MRKHWRCAIVASPSRRCDVNPRRAEQLSLSASLVRHLVRAGLIASAAFASLMVWPTFIAAQEMPVPVEFQIPLLSRILAFDRNFQTHSEDEIVVAIVYQSQFRASNNANQEVLDAVKTRNWWWANGLPMRCVSVNLSPGRNLREQLTASGADVIYVAPLRAVDIASITAVSRDLDVLTYTGVPEYVRGGVGVGLDLKANRPLIVVNLDGTREEGSAFSSELLKLARIE